MKVGQKLELEAIRLRGDGRGEGVAGPVHVRVAGLLPGERAEVAIEHVSPHRPLAWGRILRRLGPPSGDRRSPACPAFGRCGGCVWQHLAYPAQLREKRARLADVLAGAVAEAPAVCGSARIVEYRNRGKYVVGRRGGALLLGAYAPRSHDLVDTGGCRAVEPAVDRAAAAARSELERSSLTVYDERRRRGELRYVVVRSNAAGEVLVGLVTATTAPRAALAAAAERLSADPAVRGVVWIRNDATTGAILSPDRELLAGAAGLEEEVAGVPVEVDIGAFLQVNRRQADRLYAEVARWARERGCRRAVELYAGVGGIAFALARAGVETTGVEIDRRAVEAANRAAAGAGLSERARFLAGRASELPAGAAPADLAVVDPPRKGLDAETRAALLRLAAPSIAYVSCNPETLARDLRELAGGGYAPGRLLAFDLMPGTPEVEVIALLEREGPAPGPR